MHEDVLYWAAGRAQMPSPVSPSDWESVLQRVSDHRLTSRLYSRIRSERPDWIVDSIERSALSAFSVCSQEKESYIRQVESLDAALEQADASPVVVIKGLTAWAHTRDERHIVRSYDLDLLPREPAELKNLLLETGYENEVDRMPHEFANLVADDHRWDIDLHEYFPVWRYASPARTYTPGLSYRPNRVGVASSAIYSEDLLQRATNAFSTKYGRVLVPDVTDCALIRCAHIMHDYMESPYYLADEKFRLSEIAEIRDLVERQEFDPARFMEMAGKTEAFDCLSLVNQIYTLVYNEPLPLEHASIASKSDYLPPLELCWGINVEPTRRADQILEKDATFDELFEIVPPTRINLPEQAGQCWTTCPTSTAADQFETVLVNWSESEMLTFELRLGVAVDSLELNLAIDGPVGEFLEEVRLVFDTIHLTTGYEVSRNAVRLPSKEEWGGVQWETSGPGCSVSISIPMRVLTEKGLTIENSISLVIALDRFQHSVGRDWREFYTDNVISTAVPVVIQYSHLQE